MSVRGPRGFRRGEGFLRQDCAEAGVPSGKLTKERRALEEVLGRDASVLGWRGRKLLLDELRKKRAQEKRVQA